MKTRRAISSTAIGLLIVGLLVGAGISYALVATTITPSTSTVTSTATTTVSGGGTQTVTSTVTATSTATSAQQQPGSPGVEEASPEYLANIAAISPLCQSNTKITIGVLSDLSDGLSYEGVRVANSTRLAASNINAELSAIGCKVTFAADVEDYALDSTKATQIMNSWASAGVQVVVGPLNSGTARVIVSTANSDHIVLISPSSTAVGLHIVGDYLFRTAPADTWQGQADARELWSLGIKAIVVAQIHDFYGDGLAQATASDFAALGGHVVNNGSFVQWNDPPASGFQTTAATQINTDYAQAVSTYGASKVAVYIIGFDEVGQVIAQAQTDGYSSLLTSVWFGSDGTATDTDISNHTANAAEATAALGVKLPSTEYAAFNSPLLTAWSARFQKSSGFVADGYAIGGYDDFWLGALTILAVGQNNGQMVHDNIIRISQGLFGVSGWMGLDAAGDRIPYNGYDVWQITSTLTSGVYQWAIVGHWNVNDTITWTKPPI